MPTPTTFPADHELLAFFETEPRILDPDLPWFYNTIEFETERQDFLVQCKLHPSYGRISVRLCCGGMELVRLHLESFKRLSLVTNVEGEILVATFDRGLDEETFSPHAQASRLGRSRHLPADSARAVAAVDDFVRD